MSKKTLPKNGDKKILNRKLAKFFMKFNFNNYPYKQKLLFNTFKVTGLLKES